MQLSNGETPLPPPIIISNSTTNSKNQISKLVRNLARHAHIATTFPRISPALSHLLTAVNFSAMEYEFLAQRTQK